MKRVYKIILLFVIIFVIGLVVFISSINYNLNNETDTSIHKSIESSQKVTAQKIVYRKLS
jgi:uncharacterized membrane protein